MMTPRICTGSFRTGETNTWLMPSSAALVPQHWPMDLRTLPAGKPVLMRTGGTCTGSPSSFVWAKSSPMWSTASISQDSRVLWNVICWYLLSLGQVLDACKPTGPPQAWQEGVHIVRSGEVDDGADAGREYRSGAAHHRDEEDRAAAGLLRLVLAARLLLHLALLGLSLPLLALALLVCAHDLRVLPTALLSLGGLLALVLLAE